MLEAKTELMLYLFEIAEQTKTVSSLLRVLKDLDNFLDDRDAYIVHLRPDLIASASTCSWIAIELSKPDVCKRAGGIILRPDGWTIAT